MMNKLLTIIALAVMLVPLAYASKQPLEPTEENMRPFLPEDKSFSFLSGSSNSVSPVSLSYLNRDFFSETGGQADQRNTGTLLLNLLVREVLYNTPNAKKIIGQNVNREVAELIMIEFLQQHAKELPGYSESFDKTKILSPDQLIMVNDVLKREIFAQWERQNKAGSPKQQRPGLKERFVQWRNQWKQDAAAPTTEQQAAAAPKTEEKASQARRQANWKRHAVNLGNAKGIGQTQQRGTVPAGPQNMRDPAPGGNNNNEPGPGSKTGQ